MSSLDHIDPEHAMWRGTLLREMSRAELIAALLEMARLYEKAMQQRGKDLL